MPRKMLHRISRIFNHKESITAIQSDPHVSTAHITPITLQRAPSSKLLIDDYMDIPLEYNYGYYQEPKQQEQMVIMGSCKRSDHHRQSWITNLSKLKSLKKHSSNKKLKSNDCWFNQREVGETIEISDHHHEQQQQGVSESPLSLASSLCSTTTTNQINPLLSSSSTSSWLPIEEDNISTARTSLDSQRIKIDFSSSIQEQQQHQQPAVNQKQIPSSRINLAENVKHILGDAIFLADQELDI